MNRREFIAGAAFATGAIAARAGTDTAPRDFTKLDPNYRNKAVKLDGLCWHDAFKAPFELEGAPFRDQHGVPTRFPMELTEKMTHPGAYRAMGRQGAGMSLRFSTNANRIAFRATYGEFYVNQKMPMAGCGFDFYRSGRWAGNSQPPLESKDGLEWSMSFGGTGRRDGETFQLYFPLQCGIEKLQIGLPETAEVFAPGPRRYGERPIAFYGSSITHCGCVSRPGLEHGARVGRFLDAAVHNFGYCGGDMAYSAMLTKVPSGWFGVVVASMMAALFSTVAAHLTMGSSYVVNDFYRRFVRPQAGDRELIWAARGMMVVFMVLSCLIAPLLTSAKTAFDLMLLIGAGSGPIFLLRWFWMRINAWSEIAGILTALVTAIVLELALPNCGCAPLASWQKLSIGVAVTTVGWLAATFLTKPEPEAVQRRFKELVRADGRDAGKGVLYTFLVSVAIFASMGAAAWICS